MEKIKVLLDPISYLFADTLSHKDFIDHVKFLGFRMFPKALGMECTQVPVPFVALHHEAQAQVASLELFTARLALGPSRWVHLSDSHIWPQCAISLRSCGQGRVVIFESLDTEMRHVVPFFFGLLCASAVNFLWGCSIGARCFEIRCDRRECVASALGTAPSTSLWRFDDSGLYLYNSISRCHISMPEPTRPPLGNYNLRANTNDANLYKAWF
mmetsp:Transcript_22539/g.39953  ORF Transcript_22539/g.39953 Transcript_22539/m.39953 type:complete len:213 (+) Transcript_22539:38-676(+)